MEHTEKFHMDTQDYPEINRNYKDCLLRIVFKEKKDLLELYNAINGSDYQNPEELIVYTLKDVVFMGIKNDISFLIGEMLSLYEHQSSKNPNMPIRGLMYLARNYSAYIAQNNLDIYSTTLQKLPFPQYYVLYNGIEDEEDRCTIELEDAFPKIEGKEPCLKCTATLLNINYGHNREIMERCKALNDYSFFIQKIRDNQALGMPLPQAVDSATATCIQQDILKDILLKNRAEVKNMVLGIWGTENHLRKVKEAQENSQKMLEEAQKAQKEARNAQKEAQKAQKESQKRIETLEQEMASTKQRKHAADLLGQILFDSGRTKELRRSLEDADYQLELMKEYKLI